jgi:hypothetical membrane protein
MVATMTLIGAATPGRPPRRPNRLLYAGLVAGPLFVLVFLVAGALRPGYDPVRHPVSSLALGPGGWVQVVNFLLAGVLTLVFAIGLRRSLRPGPGGLTGPILVGVWGIALLGAGVFVTDPVSGYPPGTPALPAEPSRPGLLHDLFSLPGFLGLALAMLVFAYAFGRRRAWIWSVYSGLSGLGFAALFVMASAGFSQQSGLVGTAGLWQRLAVGLGWLWLALLAARQIRHQRRLD